MEAEEIGNRTIGPAVIGVADRAADDQTKREGRRTRARPQQPDEQQRDGRKRQRQEQIALEIGGGTQQRIGNAGIPGDDQIKERPDMNRLMV